MTEEMIKIKCSCCGAKYMVYKSQIKNKDIVHQPCSGQFEEIE